MTRHSLNGRKMFLLNLGLAGLVLLATMLPGRAEAPLRLSLPIECLLGQDCFVQNYVDLDPSPDLQDVQCGRATYDGHKGTDIRVLDTNVTAQVLASAPGVVKAIRNDMADRLVLSDKDKARVSGKECGNGVLIDHGNGWETQYCHMRKGSVFVREGQKVDRGDGLGLVGYSGQAAFAHVHLSVRKDGAVIDPFLGAQIDAGSRMADCAKSNTGDWQSAGLWDVPAAELLADGQGTIIQTGFANGVVSTQAVEMGEVTAPDARSPALVFFARAINLKEGDHVDVSVSGPEGFAVEAQGEALQSSKAQWVSFGGKKLRQDRWPAGTYKGVATFVRHGKAIGTSTASLTLY
ncbi:M23 family metallopeptidase [Roseibium sediminis]|uniref:M23 family metallopeptidase n=1 Tax=Roseibium sediminis TaxID=1775174 RepID=UPI00123DF51E|nr:M23 family metallopeptidase [Roseibium sediminis]